MKVSSRVLAAVMALGVGLFAVGCGQEQKPADSQGAKVIQKVIDAPVRQDFKAVGEIKERT